jgi:competence ComEA-like helix-hairpin-helix protein
MAERILPYVQFSPQDRSVHKDATKVVSPMRVDINRADSAQLVAIDGIGAKSAAEIIKYRELLGGYYSVEQISELSVVLDKNFEQILPQIYCDSAEIKKININFAASNELKTHPYITSRMLKLIINTRVSKGGWSTIEEMIEDDILTSEEAMRIAPYLDFGTDSE